LNIDNGRYTNLDEISSLVWKLIQEKIKVGEIIDIMMSKFRGSAEEIERDVLTLLDQFSQRGFLSVFPPES
jgi:hypothetical protein